MESWRRRYGLDAVKLDSSAEFESPSAAEDRSWAAVSELLAPYGLQDPDEHHLRRPSLGTLLVRAELLSEDQVQEASGEGMRSGETLGEVAIRRGWASEGQVAELLAEQWQLPYADADAVAVDPEAMTHVSYDAVRELELVPIGFDGDGVVLATASPTQALFTNVRRQIGEVSYVVVTRSALDALLDSVEFGAPPREGQAAARTVVGQPPVATSEPGPPAFAPPVLEPSALEQAAPGASEELSDSGLIEPPSIEPGAVESSEPEPPEPSEGEPSELEAAEFERSELEPSPLEPSLEPSAARPGDDRAASLAAASPSSAVKRSGPEREPSPATGATYGAHSEDVALYAEGAERSSRAEGGEAGGRPSRGRAHAALALLDEATGVLRSLDGEVEELGASLASALAQLAEREAELIEARESAQQDEEMIRRLQAELALRGERFEALKHQVARLTETLDDDGSS